MRKNVFRQMLLLVVISLCFQMNADAQKLNKLYNQLSPKRALNLENAAQLPVPGVATAKTAVWNLEPVAGEDDYFRLVNHETGKKLSFDNGKLVMISPDDKDENAMWTKEPVKGTTLSYIINKDKGQRLNISNGQLQVSDISGTSMGAKWRIAPVRSPGTGGGTTTSAKNKKGINDFINSLTYDPRKLMAVEGDGGTILQDKQVGSSSDRKTDNNAVILCTTEKYSMSNNFDEVVIMQPTNGIVYPGALIYADNFLVRGQPRPVTNLALAPVRLTVDLPGIGSKGNMLVKSPSNANVQMELQKALKYWNENPAYKEGYINAARSSSSAAMSFNSEQIGMSLGVNVKWASGEVASQFSFNTSSSKSVAVMMFKQVFYTVTSEPPATPAEAFGNITPAKAMVTFNNEAPPAYIQSVSYGRIIMFRMETSEKVNEADLKASLKYAAGAVTAEGDMAFKYQGILRNSSITYAILGGNALIESRIASAGNFKDLEPLIKGKLSVYSKSNPGVPIAYTVRFLKDHQIAKMGFTTEYTKENCQRYPNLFIKLNHAGAYVAKYEITWNDNGQDRKIETGNKTAGWTETFYFPGDATNISVRGWAATGLVWDPWGEIYNKKMQAADMNKCLRNTGTTLGRSFDNNCQ